MPRLKRPRCRPTSIGVWVLLVAGAAGIAPPGLLAERRPAVDTPPAAADGAKGAKTACAVCAPEPVDPALVPVLKQLSEAGAWPVGPSAVRIGLSRAWKGTDDDVKLLNQLPGLRTLQLDLGYCAADVLSQLNLPPLEELALHGLSDDVLAKTTHLPTCTKLQLFRGSAADAGKARPPLSAEAYRKVAELATGVTYLQISGGAWSDWRTIDNDGLKAIGQIASLEELSIQQGSFTDEGLSHLAGLKNLARLHLNSCRSAVGPGFANLAAIESLRSLGLAGQLINGPALAALSTLTQLEQLGLAISGFPAADLKPEDFAPLEKLTNLKRLSIGRWDGSGGFPNSPGIEKDFPLGNAILRAAGKLPALQTFALGRIGTNAAGVEALAGAPQLTGLGLTLVDLDDRCLKTIGQLTKLEGLHLGGARNASVDCKHLAQCAQLTDLALNDCRLSAESLGSLADLPALNGLNLSCSTFQGEIAAPLGRLTGLKKLELFRSNFDDNAAQAFGELTALESLDLQKTLVTARVLDDIAKLSNLRKLTIGERSVTVDGLRKLRQLKNLRQVMVLSPRGNPYRPEDREDERRLAATIPGVVSVSPDGPR